MELGPTGAGADHSGELVRRLRNGDRTALDELYRQQRDPLLFAIRARLGPRLRERLESEDVLQSVFKDALSDIHRFEPRSSGSLARWLHICVLNKIRSKAEHFGARKRSGAVRLSDSIAEGAVGPGTQLGYREPERWEQLERAMGHLAPLARELLLLRSVEGLTNEQAAEVLGKTTAATAKAYTRALARLGVLLAEGTGAP